MTTKELITYLSGITSNSKFISSFFVGDKLEQQSSGNDLYPQLVLETPLIFDLQYPKKNQRIALVILDLMKNSEEDKIDLLDKTEQIGYGVCEKIKETYSITEPNFLQVDEYGNDNTIGWRIEFDLSTVIKLNTCYLPFN